MFLHVFGKNTEINNFLKNEEQYIRFLKILQFYRFGFK